MKNRIFIIIAASMGCLLTACTGGRNPQTGKDTVTNTYHVKDTSKIDTGKITSPDNTASGGTNLMKDTSKHVKPKN